ncbi:MAG: DUF6152 family protein [Woeseiaceae bacterium]
MKYLCLILTAITFLTSFVAAEAHHSFAATFIEDETIQVEGVVTEFSFRNPHVLIYLDVMNDDGTTTNWMSEGSSATALRRTGWSRDSFEKGDLLRVSGNATRDGSPMVSIEKVEVLDPNDRSSTAIFEPGGYGGSGRERAREPETIPLKLADGRPNLTGNWLENRTERKGRPGEQDPPLPWNGTGAALQTDWNPANDPQVFCDPPGVVRQASWTPHPIRIIQNDDHIVFEYEEYGGRRVIKLSDELPQPGAKSHLGDAVAHYEGDTLVVRNVNLLGNPTGTSGNRLSDQTTTTEVYRRADDPRYGAQVAIKTTITDPGHLQEPWVIERLKMYAANYEFIENDCRPPLRERN